jgi:protein tyrosine/serine phosphatase
LGVLAYGIFWWSEHKYEYIPKRWGVVVPGKIFRSGQLTPEIMKKTLTEHGITTIIDLQLNDLVDEHLQAEVRYAQEHGLRHYRFGLGGDGTGDVARYVDAVAMLVECVRDNRPVLVHCAAGTQRTGGVVACYRLLIEGADPQEVTQELKDYDWNPEGDWELSEYINSNLPYIAEQLVERGALDRVPAVNPRLAE